MSGSSDVNFDGIIQDGLFVDNWQKLQTPFFRTE